MYRSSRGTQWYLLTYGIAKLFIYLPIIATASEKRPFFPFMILSSSN